MISLKRKPKIKQELRSFTVPSVANAPVSTAISEYNKSMEARKKIGLISVAALLGFEGLIAGGLISVIKENDLNNRVMREYEMRRSGQIEMQTGDYTGETDFGYFFGNGEFSFDSGTVYSGTWSDNRYSGAGELKIPSEGTYTGDFSGFQKSGAGTFVWDDGTVYSGEWKNDCMDGQGEYKEKRGPVYTGTFKENSFEAGQCVFVNNTGEYQLTYKGGEIDSAEISFTDGTHYTGAVSESEIDGLGEMIFPNQDVYSGSFEDGKRSGNGTYTWNSGDTYDGKWAADSMSGKGIYTYSNGAELNGTFEDNKFITGTYHVTNDFGEYLFNFENGEPNAVAIILSDGTIFTGDVSDGGLNGRAQIIYSNGDTYEGTVKNAVKSGQGTYKWISGASYDGSWKNDQMSGRGTYMYPANEDGYKLVGNFSKGLPDGECKYYTDSSTSYDTTWTNGKCTKVTE